VLGVPLTKEDSDKEMLYALQNAPSSIIGWSNSPADSGLIFRMFFTLSD
jgi:hypothetical protein